METCPLFKADLQMKTSVMLYGYQWLWQRMICNGFNVKQETVRVALKAINPTGVEERKRNKLRRTAYHSQGANFT